MEFMFNSFLGGEGVKVKEAFSVFNGSLASNFITQRNIINQRY